MRATPPTYAAGTSSGTNAAIRRPDATSTAHGSASPSPTSSELGTNVVIVEAVVTSQGQSPGRISRLAQERKSARCISIAVGTRIAR